jgi:acetyl esterase/lipase
MKNFSKVTYSIALMLLVFTSCKKTSTVMVDPKITVESKSIINVAYGSHASQLMDVYLPANRTANTNVIVFVHGGSFIGGDKSDFTSLVKELVRNDFAVLNINYKLVDASGLYDSPVKHLESEVKIKDQVSDVGLAVDYAISHAKEWQISQNKMALVGHSAGATLSLLYTYDARNTNKIKAVVNLAGALDQTFSDIPSVLLQFLPDYVLEGGYRYTGYEVNIANDIHYRAISPLYVANSAQKVPTLNVFPENNAVGDLPKQGRATFDAFTNKLNSLGVPNKFVQIAGADHEFSKPGNFATVLAETVAYLNANLK